MARAYAIAKDYQSARNYINKAREQLDVSTTDAEDKKVYSEQIRETEEMVGKYRSYLCNLMIIWREFQIVHVILTCDGCGRKWEKQPDGVRSIQ